MAKLALLILIIAASCRTPYRGYTFKYVPVTIIFPDGHSITFNHRIIDSMWLKGYVVPDLKIDTSTTYLQRLGNRCGLTHSCVCDTIHKIPATFSTGSVMQTDSGMARFYYR